MLFSFLSLWVERKCWMQINILLTVLTFQVQNICFHSLLEGFCILKLCNKALASKFQWQHILSAEQGVLVAMCSVWAYQLHLWSTKAVVAPLGTIRWWWWNQENILYSIYPILCVAPFLYYGSKQGGCRSIPVVPRNMFSIPKLQLYYFYRCSWT